MKSIHAGDNSSLMSKTSQRSMTSVLAMQRTRRQRLEYQRKKSVLAASEFGMLSVLSVNSLHIAQPIYLLSTAKLSSLDKTVQPQKTLAMILKRQKSVVPNADLIK